MKIKLIMSELADKEFEITKFKSVNGIDFEFTTKQGINYSMTISSYKRSVFKLWKQNSDDFFIGYVESFEIKT